MIVIDKIAVNLLLFFCVLLRIERVDGTEIGNRYHKFMRDYDFEETFNSEYVDKNKIRDFLHSKIGQEMKFAYQNKLLYREYRFMRLFDYVDILKLRQSYNQSDRSIKEEIDKIEKDNIDKKVIVQGVIDAFYIKKNEGRDSIVVVDYKTDGINNSVSIEKLKEMYRVQLDIYGKCLSEISKINVEKKFIYSFALSECIEV